ncbi:DUF3226 domain-containing protein [Plantibacter sp. LMC-P-059a]|uniref:DUF3226 domain-containing protein n=1 Tax=Plantibacter sp. LMC-P-059a TaxID=3040297 RepID=UPI00254AE50C|nr:DUF3226 domain-containing protein [Plantibacter sp. LMC-P-059a]
MKKPDIRTLVKQVKRTPFDDKSGRFDRPLLVFVEGADDQAFTAATIARFGKPLDWQIHEMGGNRTPWADMLEVALDDDWFHEQGRSIAFVLDADDDPDAALARVALWCTNNGLPVPTAHGTVVRDGRWAVGAFIMPDGARRGALEELLIDGADTARLEAAEAYIDAVADTFGEMKWKNKSLLLAYFAGHGQAQMVSHVPLAVQITGVFDHDGDAFKLYRDFLLKLAE